MNTFDVAVIGTGPAGVSAALPLVGTRHSVLLIDGGEPKLSIPKGDYLTMRFHDQNQGDWMVGQDYTAVRNVRVGSPKFRVPGTKDVFDGFADANRIVAENFMVVGSLASGGLSNVWGCGVAQFNAHDLRDFPLDEQTLAPHYSTVLSRIGVSGRADDDLAAFFGVDRLAQPPLDLDTNHAALLGRYRVRRGQVGVSRMLLGRARLAALTFEHAGRLGCDRSGLCLWGCSRQALYNANQELSALVRRDNVTWQTDTVVESITSVNGGVEIRGRRRVSSDSFTARARFVVLAAGTLASTRLAFDAMHYREPVRLLSNPVVAFLLWQPSRLGAPTERPVGLPQLSFVLDDAHTSGPVFGNLFSPAALPISEFARHVPFLGRYGIDVLKYLLPSTIVGNCYFPGGLSDHTVRIDASGSLHVKGGNAPPLFEALTTAKRRLRSEFASLRAYMLPGGFVQGVPGCDVHYAGTIPMRANPAAHQAFDTGEIAGLAGVYVADGTALSSLPAKAHTLTIMANATRIGLSLVERLVRERS
jgi:choline dehydrogenase-like flavoprotein